MRVNGPMFSLDARGRLKQAVVYSIWRGINYVRGFVVPTNPNSTRQVYVRGLFTSASRAWASLTDDQRTAWDAWAEENPLTDIFGAEYTVTGMNAFLGLWVVSTDLGETPVEDPPTSSAPPVVGTLDINPGTSNGEIDFTWADGSEADFVDAWITAAIPQSRKAGKSDYRHNSYTAIASETKTISGLTAGAYYWCAARLVRDNGQTGPFISMRVQAKTGA